MSNRQAETDHDTQAARRTAGRQYRRAALLALVCGYIDAYAYLNYKLYVSFMSGNTTQTGLQLGKVNLTEAGRDFLPIVAFTFGVFAGTLLLHSRLRQPLRWLFAAVALLLTASLVSANLGATLNWLNIMLLSTATGAANTTVTRVGAQSLSLGYVTGVLNNLAQHLALAAKRLPVPQAEGNWDTHGRRAFVLASVWIAFLIGALFGGVLTPQFAMWTLLPPVVIFFALAATANAPSEAG